MRALRLVVPRPPRPRLQVALTGGGVGLRELQTPPGCCDCIYPFGAFARRAFFHCVLPLPPSAQQTLKKRA